MSAVDKTYSVMGCFSVIFFSQIIDNLRNVKRLFIVIEALIAINVLFFGIFLLTKDQNSTS
jgi:predicted membrane channel-forming protein YqfA (hemolysin III family)